MKKIKKNVFGIGLVAAMALGTVFSFAPQNAEAAVCPTGNSQVKSSWWGPSNDTYFTMCNCSTKKGYEASGSCSGAVEII